jgi:carboxypeptidase PM20D1
MMVVTLAQLRHAGWKPARDVILALTGDEETTGRGAMHLARQLQGAELALNGDVGGGLLAPDGVTPVLYEVQGGEKTYTDMTLTVTDVGGHSSHPTSGNAIYRLARALGRVEAYAFPVMSNELTRAYFSASAPNTPGPLGEAMRRYVANPEDHDALAQLLADKEYVAQLRTTCVATQISGGHAANALPQRAVANVNCRVFPGTSAASVQQALRDAIGDSGVQVDYNKDWTIESKVSPLRRDVMAAVDKAVHARYPGLPIVPNMSAGSTDGTHYRNVGVPVYGVSGLFMRPEDDFSHGLDERVPVAAIDGALAHWNSMIRALAR